ncbi:MAG TPA: hypothetical protein VM513_13350, partial [Kofleriaceae bacterium]|nr:hypothetical protein [Kofleriaceae bacterium]
LEAYDAYIRRNLREHFLGAVRMPGPLLLARGDAVYVELEVHDDDGAVHHTAFKFTFEPGTSHMVRLRALLAAVLDEGERLIPPSMRSALRQGEAMLAAIRRWSA